MQSRHHHPRREVAPVAAGALDFAFERVQQGAVIAQASERVADGELPHLFEQARIIEQRAAENQSIAARAQAERQRERRIESVQRLRGGKMAGHINPQGDAERAGEAELRRIGVPGDGLVFRAPNTMWLQAGYPVEPAFTAALRDAAAVSVRDADFIVVACGGDAGSRMEVTIPYQVASNAVTRLIPVRG